MKHHGEGQGGLRRQADIDAVHPDAVGLAVALTEGRQDPVDDLAQIHCEPFLAPQQAVGLGQGHDSPLEGVDRRPVRGAAQGLTGDGQHRGQGVLGAMVQLAEQEPQMVLLLPVSGKVHQRGEMLHHLAGLVAHRTDEHGRPERASVLTPALQVQKLFGASGEHGLDLGPRVGRGVLGEQEVEVLAEDFLAGVAGQRQEAVIGENDPIVRLRGVGEHHRHAGGFRGDDKRTLVPAQALDGGFRAFLRLGLVGDLGHRGAWTRHLATETAGALFGRGPTTSR